MEVFYGGIDNLFLWILMAPMVVGFIALMLVKEEDNGRDAR